MLWRLHSAVGNGILAFACLMLLIQGAGAGEIGILSQKSESGTERFQVLEEFGGEAVFDLETELIWERSPSRSAAVWSRAPVLCARKSVGGRKGWRLPSFLELMTLVNPSTNGAHSGPTLPPGHPFLGVKAETYWSVTSLPAIARQAYAVDFLIGDVAPQGKSRLSHYWCVRGGASGTAHPRADRDRELV